ncbi:trypsin epsilon-like isoform X2 [Poecilia latipinna]|uniref:trypsin epsilon-like isoform X2 n=1 Tax=Poecilia latipinna TaxID=48699 RepID=UPI00072D9375|nr:PREDICTED: trypsin epsilon-like isoform X2 [Poecilia latipinna]
MSEPGWTNTAILKVNPRTAGQQSQVIQDKPVTYTHDDHQHGIILLKLQTPVTDVQPALLPDCRRRFRGHNVKLAGEGATTTGPNNKQLNISAIPAHLQCVDMKVVAVSLVELPYGHIFRAKAPNKEICYGDTGGAALHSGKIYGVISFGGEGACQSSATIMDVCKYKNWIKKTIKPGK